MSERASRRARQPRAAHWRRTAAAGSSIAGRRLQSIPAWELVALCIGLLKKFALALIAVAA